MRDPQAWTSRAAAFESWSEWAAKAGEYVGTRQRFIDALEARGFEPRNRSTGRGFAGFRLKPPDFNTSWSGQ